MRLKKSGRWEMKGQKIWEVGDQKKNDSGRWEMSPKKSGRWEMSLKKSGRWEMEKASGRWEMDVCVRIFLRGYIFIPIFPLDSSLNVVIYVLLTRNENFSCSLRSQLFTMTPFP